MSEYLQFNSREEFRKWLQQNCLHSEGVWLRFSKKKDVITIKADEALEEALCFGWIDGQMKSLDDTFYIKYFALRRKNSNWSEKNKALVDQLEKRGIMTDHGRQKIAEARSNGQWDTTKRAAITEEEIAEVTALLRGHEPAYLNFQAMPPSVKKAYTGAYLDAKTEEGRTKRLAWMIDRLNKNLKPM